jgi:hypothetical protein
MTAHVLTARTRHARVRFPGLYRLINRLTTRGKSPYPPLPEFAAATPELLTRLRDALMALPAGPSPRATPPAVPFAGASLAGLPDGVIAVKQQGRDTVTFPAVQGPVPAPVTSVPVPAPEPYTSIGIRGADNYLRCSERLAGDPLFDGLGIDKKTGQKYAAVLLGAGQSDSAEPGDQWEIGIGSPGKLTLLGLAVIEALPELTSDGSFLQQLIFAAQEALNAQTMGGPAVDQQAGDDAQGGAQS